MEYFDRVYIEDYSDLGALERAVNMSILLHGGADRVQTREPILSIHPIDWFFMRKGMEDRYTLRLPLNTKSFKMLGAFGTFVVSIDDRVEERRMEIQVAV